MEQVGEAEPPQHKFGVTLGVVYVINTSIGAGFLTLPFAFRYGGIVMSMLVLITIGVINWMITFQSMSIMARCESIA
jgi:amino acid permease